MNWWRAHHGISNDSKLAVCAQRAKARRCEVLAVWVALLDFASQNDNDRGSICGLDQDQIAAITDIKLSCVESIMNEFKRRGMVTSEGRLTAWDKRQPRRERDDSDSTTDRDRQRRFRQKLKDGGPTDSLQYMRHFPVVFARDGGCCVYCGDSDRDLLGLDHGVPRCMGGDDDVMNLYLSCRRCNSSKGGRTPDEARFPFKNHNAAELFEENKRRLSQLKLDVTPGLAVTPCHAQRRGEENRGEYITPLTPQGGIEQTSSSVEINPLVGQPSASNGHIPVKSPKQPKRNRKPNRTIAEIREALGPTRLPWWEAFWKVFPVNGGTNEAMDAYERRILTREMAIQVYNGAKRYAIYAAEQSRSDPKFRPKWGQGWINNERFVDDFNLKPVEPEPPPPPKPIKTVPYDPMALWKAQKLAEQQQEEDQLEVKVQ